MWWADGSHSEDGRVGAAVACKHRNEWRSCCSFLCTRCMEVFDAELWAIRIALDMAIDKRDTMQMHAVKTVAAFSDLQAAIRSAAHLEPGPGQRLARRINRMEWSRLGHGIATEIHQFPEHSRITGQEEVDRQATLARDAIGCTVI